MDARTTARLWPLLALTLAALPACAPTRGAPEDSDSWEFTHNQYVGVVGGSVDRTYRATMAAVEQLGMTVRAQSREATRAQVRAREADGTSVEINLLRQSGEFTRVTVHIGVLGDEARSRAIVAKIKENL